MQRSRKALVRRRAAVAEKGFVGRKRLYKVKHVPSCCSLNMSLVVVLWGLVFLLNSFIGHGNGYRVDESSWHEIQPDPSNETGSGVSLAKSEATLDSNDQKTAASVNKEGAGLFEATLDSNDQKTAASANKEGAEPSAEVLASKDDKLNLSSVEKEKVADRDIKSEGTLPVKNDRLSRVTHPGLDEFKHKVINAKEKHLSKRTGTVIHRVEPDGKEYNYASATKGAKVLAFNKEANGPSNILDKDKDKYLRNPCSAEAKYVVIELSEETLVDAIEIANFEHYSSNLKDFALLSSLTYPTDHWVNIGNFTAGNMKHPQRFTLPEPKWARYLKLNMLNHYGSEFYCTLSVVEVYGVDVVERMLEDLIALENKRPEPEEENAAQMPLQESPEGDDPHHELSVEMDNESQHESLNIKREMTKNSAPGPVVDIKPGQVGRMPADTVLKILMQKVQSLDVNFLVLERYLEELNSRYGHIFKDFDDDIAAKDSVLETVILAIKNLENSKDVFASDIGELLSWRYLVSSQMDQLVKDNSILRSEVERVHDRQVDMENKGIVVIFFSFVFGCLAVAKLFIAVLLTLCRIYSWEIFCRTSSAWLVLLLSSSIIAVILVL